MSKDKLPFSKDYIEEVVKKYPTPFHIYDEKAIRQNVRNLKKAFSWVSGFKEYFAVKACPNPYILEILRDEGCGADCSSMGELVLSEATGIVGDDIMFTSNDTPPEEFQKANKLGAVINFDDITHIPFFKEKIGKLPKIASCRYNPGPLKEGNAIIGSPEEAKYGLTREQLFEAYEMLKNGGVDRFGLHTMVASNELDPEYFIETARLLFETVKDIEERVGIQFEFINLGGGIGIPYKPEQKPVDLNKVSEGIKSAYDEIIGDTRDSALKIVMEMGRMITGPYGYLVTRAIHKKNTYKNYIGVDASMANLMRPGLYGAYHHITVLGKENLPKDHKYDVVGSLCENNDKFAIDRQLPEIENNDLLVIQDAGAHGYAMGFNYNAKLKSSELFMKEDGSVQQIRRAETLDDYFITLNYPGLY